MSTKRKGRARDRDDDVEVEVERARPRPQTAGVQIATTARGITIDDTGDGRIFSNQVSFLPDVITMPAPSMPQEMPGTDDPPGDFFDADVMPHLLPVEDDDEDDEHAPAVPSVFEANEQPAVGDNNGEKAREGEFWCW